MMQLLLLQYELVEDDDELELDVDEGLVVYVASLQDDEVGVIMVDEVVQVEVDAHLVQILVHLLQVVEDLELEVLDEKVVMLLDTNEVGDEIDYIDTEVEVEGLLELGLHVLDDFELMVVVMVDVMRHKLDVMLQTVDDDEVDELTLVMVEIELDEQQIYAMLVTVATEYTLLLDEIVVIYAEIYVYTDSQATEHSQY